MNEIELTQAQKAAAILVAMGKPAAGRLLKLFKQEELKALMEAARTLRTIPQADLEQVVAEFESEFAEGVGLLDSGDKMDTIINETLTPEEVTALRSEQAATVLEGPDPIWAAVGNVGSERLGAFLTAEHPQAVAFILSNLSSDAAASALLALPKPMRSDVVRRMMSLNVVQPAAKRIIEDQLQQRLLSGGETKSAAGAQIKVASLLNELDKSEVDDVLSELAKSGASGLDAIRAQLFAFEDIPVLSQTARVKLFDGLSTELVTLALRNADPALVEAALSAVGARSRRMIEAELGVQAPAVQADIARARKTIASTAIRLAGEGQIELPSTQAAA